MKITQCQILFLGLQHTGQLLVESGANLNVIDPEYGYTPLQLSLMMSKWFNNVLIIENMKINQINSNYFSLKVNGSKIAELLIKNGANLNIASKDGMTALHRSIQYGKIKHLFD